MTDWECPNCHGGFPEPVNDARTEQSECPWCGQPINGSYEYVSKIVSRVEKRDTETGSLLGKLRA